jgi:hypothetical protein
MDPHFMYLSWQSLNRNQSLAFKDDQYGTVRVTTSAGVYKNNYSEHLMDKHHNYYWEIKILKGTYFKIGIIKHSEIPNVKRAFSDHKDGFAFYSPGKLRNGSNKDGQDFKKGYGPGDVVKVRFNPSEGKLYFGVNDEPLEEAFNSADFKKGGYVAAVGALLEDSRYSLTLPDL